MLWSWHSFMLQFFSLFFFLQFFSLFYDQWTIIHLKIRELPTFPSIFCFIFWRFISWWIHSPSGTYCEVWPPWKSPLLSQIACLLCIKDLFLLIYHIEKNNLNLILKYYGKIKIKWSIPRAHLLYKEQLKLE